MHKTWNKSLHKRKIWKYMSLPSKIIYYMQPLMEHLFDIWMQPLPFPTLLKFIYTCGISFFLLLPIIYPFLVCIFYFGVVQYFAERHFEIQYPEKWDLLGAVNHIIYYRVTNKKYLLFVAMYIDRYRVILTALSSSVDYMRMALCLVFG